MIKKINDTLLNVGYLSSIDYVVIHNDAGAMTPTAYLKWLRKRPKHLGIAHYYINKDEIVRVVDTNKIAYHTGYWQSNIRSIGYEICQSAIASLDDFLANEDVALMQVAEDMLFYGMDINENTVKLHCELSLTACPHRSLAIHGTISQTKKYFVQRIKHFASLGSSVEEMLAKHRQEQAYIEQSLDKIALEVIAGKWSNGLERKIKLTQAGYDYQKIQTKVNEILGV